MIERGTNGGGKGVSATKQTNRVLGASRVEDSDPIRATTRTASANKRVAAARLGFRAFARLGGRRGGRRRTSARARRTRRRGVTMGERKVLNKYIPPDFDPAKIPRSKKGTGVKAQQKVRMMLPMSIRCDTCGNYITKGTKFNARKEDVIGEDYLGITIFRFYFRCNRCSAEIAMKTDPKNADYVVEAGAKRNFEPWREKDEAQAAADEQQEREEEGNNMKALENRTLESKREMDIMAALDEMRSLNARHAKISSADAIGALRAQSEADRVAAEEAEEAMAKRVFEEAKARTAGFVRRLDSDEDDEDEDGAGLSGDTGAAAKRRKVTAATDALAPSAARAAATARPTPTFAVKPKARVVVEPKPTPEPERSGSDSRSAGGLGLLGDYGSESQEE